MKSSVIRLNEFEVTILLEALSEVNILSRDKAKAAILKTKLQNVLRIIDRVDKIAIGMAIPLPSCKRIEQDKAQRNSCPPFYL